MSEVKERPILFSPAMIRALLDGKKTQTRRIVKADFHHGPGMAKITPINNEFLLERWPEAERSFNNFGRCDRIRCPYGVPGDRLWVRETFGVWRKTSVYCDEFEVGKEATRGMTLVEHEAEYGHNDLNIAYRADADDEGPWYPSIFMPRWASRTTLEITDVRVQRLKDISEEDALAEGIVWRTGPRYSASDDHNMEWDRPTDAYRELWESINGEGSWSANPWVWVVEFRRVDGEL